VLNIILNNFKLRLAINIFMLIMAHVIFLKTNTSSLKIMSVVLLGLVMVNAIELAHECIHGIALKKKVNNYIAGTFLSAIVFVSFLQYRKKHILHHREVGVDNNSEFFHHRNESNSLSGFFIFLFNMRPLLKHFYQYNFNLIKNIYSLFLGAKTSKVTKIESLVQILQYIIIALIIYSLEIKSSYVIFYFSAYFLIYGPIHTLVEYPEHSFCDVKNLCVYYNTRSISSNKFMMWFTNFNNYHTEHHKYPNIPFNKLHSEHLSSINLIKYKNKSYTEFYFNLFLKLNHPLKNKIKHVNLNNY
jgi:fatty acid desaturase